MLHFIHVDMVCVLSKRTSLGVQNCTIFAELLSEVSGHIHIYILYIYTVHVTYVYIYIYIYLYTNLLFEV